jgi:putative hydrolase of HD superfamily
MCLVHDLAESVVGDLTPNDKVGKEEKAKLEKVSILQS